MSRFRGSKFKKARQFRFSILENNKEFSKGKKRTTPPGQHGLKRKRRPSGYGMQLREKQKVRFMYGLSEQQFRNTFIKAKKMKGILGNNFLTLLESRLDNIVYRLGLATTRDGARQMVNHSHILVNNHKVNIPSYQCHPGDEITIKQRYHQNPLLISSLEQQSSTLPFVEFNKKTMTGKYVRYPERAELNQEINENVIVEWYNLLI